MKKISLFIISLLIGALAVSSFYAGLFSGFENFFEDLIFPIRPIHPDIVIISIDNESILKLGQWPFKRKYFADLLLKLKRAKAVGLDVIFSEPSRWGDEDDNKLKNALSKISYPLVMPLEKFTEEEIKPLEQLRQNAELGNVNLIIDKDGIARRFPIIDFFALKIAQKAGFQIAENFFSEPNPRIVYAGPPEIFPRIPLWQVLFGEIPPDRFENKIVLIGATAPDLHDEQITPFSKGKPMSGVEIQANIINMLINGYYLTPLKTMPMVLWILAASLLPAIFFAFLKHSLGPLFINLIIGIIYNIGAFFIADNGIIPNFIHLNVAWFFSTISLMGFKYFIGEREKREIKTLFSKYVNAEVLQEILKNPSAAALGGKETNITVLFSDLRNFTSFSEKMPPSELVKFLNEYFETMSNEILKYRGVVDKYIGDAVMAFWGAPLTDENQADNAVSAALGMISALKQLNEKLKTLGKAEINIGIGIYSGPAVVGNIGSKTRFDYTAIGDTVNVASRLEGLNKTYNTNIIFGESVKNKLKQQYNLSFLDSVEVKGRKQPLNIYTIS
ncbi:adenylate/guanylate cyclase domain-containing protein [Candidatus Wolfebacteria bacterium]|nr:adenylate/guanylate cyclase domain-containing protein [Candidatus Wolfebacteria bacterium]